MNNPSSALLLILVAAATCATTAAASTPAAAKFWEEALPGTPMPPTIAELVQKGTDHSPLKQHPPSSSSSSSPPQTVYQPDWCLGYSYRITCSPSAAATTSAATATGVFFRHDTIAVGSVMTAHFPPVNNLPAILPHTDAENAPFTNITDVLSTFSIAPNSAEDRMVRATVTACMSPPLAGEYKACATSLEGAIRAAARMLGANTKRMSVAASALTTSHGLPRQEYEVAAVTPLGGRHVTCHDDPFPYAVYRCHLEKEAASTEAYVLTLRGLQRGGISGGGKAVVVDMVAVCHLDTSSWSPAHPAFQTLNLRPGGAPVCHFMPYADLLFTEN